MGKLTKQGSGTLALTGDNSYSGGTEIKAGTVLAESASALGLGDVYVNSGTLSVAVDSTPLNINGRFTLLRNGTLKIKINKAQKNGLRVHRSMLVLGGKLIVNLGSDASLRRGSVIPLIQGRHIVGRFSSISEESGRQLQPIYTANSVFIRIIR